MASKISCDWSFISNGEIVEHLLGMKTNDPWTIEAALELYNLIAFVIHHLRAAGSG